MRDLQKMRERFIRDGSAVRMGNLASDLLRLSKWIQARHNDEAIIDLMREIAWLMEWSGDPASAELVDMQREICRWRASGRLKEYATLWHSVHSRCQTGFWNGQDFFNRLHLKRKKTLETHLSYFF